MGEVTERCDDAGSTPNGWTRAVRCDRSRLARAERTAAGGVRVPGAVVRAGVLVYQTPDGATIRELVPPEEVSNADSLRTLRDAPVTVGHPPPDGTGSQRVTPESYRQLAVGHVSGEPRVDEEDGVPHAVADLVVLDADAIRRVDSGELVELSPGYVCMIDPTPGTYHGERYDRIQRQRQYNHVALLPEGGARGGESVALRVDGAPLDFAVQVAASEERTDSMSSQEDILRRWEKRLDEREEKLDEEEKRLAAERRDMEAAAAEEEKKADSDLETMKAERDTLAARVAELEAKIAKLESPEVADARADARARLLSTARQVLGAEFAAKRADGRSMPDREIKVAVLAKLAPDVDASTAPEAYIDARYDTHVALLPTQRPLATPFTPAPPPAAGRADSHAQPTVGKHSAGRTAPALRGRIAR